MMAAFQLKGNPMRRPIESAYPINYLLRQRWSPRTFSDRNVEPEKIRSVLEAARWAASSSNEQPWNFLVALKSETAEFEKMLSCLVEKNQQWARSAPVLMLACASTVSPRTQKPNRHAYYDLGQAVMSLVVEATALGLHLHQMAGFSPDKARELYAIPHSADAVAAIAIGYVGDPNSLPDELKSRELTPSERKPLGEFVYAGRWGERASFLK